MADKNGKENGTAKANGNNKTNNNNGNNGEVDEEDAFDEKLDLQVKRNSVLGSSVEDPTRLEIQRLPKHRPTLSTRLSTKFSNAGKAMHIFKDRKKKRVDENHKHFLTAHCIRDGIRYTTKNVKDEEAYKHAVVEDSSFRLIKRTTLPITTTHRDDDDESSVFMTAGHLKFRRPSFGSVSSNFSFSTNATNGGGKNSSTFEYKEYAPHVFLKLRQHWGISQQAYIDSLARNVGRVLSTQHVISRYDARQIYGIVSNQGTKKT
eukprot:scaffold23929_cov127-Cylindrotheca_fusiformis.AAC.2